MERKPVLTKSDFVCRYAQGEFGNASPTWNTLEQFHEHLNSVGIVTEQRYHLRNRTAGGETHYDKSGDGCSRLWQRKVDKGQWYVSAMCPTEKTIFQGEVMQTPEWSGRCGLDLFYSTVAKPMREALKEKSHSVSGIIASLTLRHFLCPNSYEWLMYLLEAYPYHVVEFTTLSTKWGTLPGYNTLVWEVRAY